MLISIPESKKKMLHFWSFCLTPLMMSQFRNRMDYLSIKYIDINELE